jgi:hypothetical protein
VAVEKSVIDAEDAVEDRGKVMKFDEIKIAGFTAIS